MRPILHWPDPRLAARCSAVEDITADIKELAEDMLETMYAAPGRGLAAPQVGVLKRIFVMDATWKDGDRDPQVFVNPEILGTSEVRATASEGCLSLPGVTAEVSRPVWVDMAWRDLSGQERRGKLEGFSALCAQHELDHLNGLMTLDRLSDAARGQVLAEYQTGAA